MGKIVTNLIMRDVYEFLQDEAFRDFLEVMFLYILKVLFLECILESFIFSS